MNMMLANTDISFIRKMTEECDRHGGLNLGQGLCTLPPAPEVIRAACDAIQNGHNSYVGAQGIEELREALAYKLRLTNGIVAADSSNILITAGATGGYIAALSSICAPDDSIILVEPFYGYHHLLAKQARLNVRTLELVDGDPAVLREQLDSRSDIIGVKAVVICTPSNPSGRVFSKEELAVIVAWAAKHDIWLITDETYEYYVYDDRRHVSAASLADSNAKIVSIFSFSKTYSIPGWRLGYTLAPQTIMPRLIGVHDRFYICPPTPLQRAALAALSLDECYYNSLQNDFHRRRDLLCQALSKTPIKPMVPGGAYYVWADVSSLGRRSAFEASMHILKVAGVASIPGSAFYASGAGDRWVRFCFAVPQAELEQAAYQLSTRLD